jgi:hypothetical protein
MVNTEKENHKMINRLSKWITELFKLDYQTRLEQYIASRYPLNTGDVERLEKEYNRFQHRGFL